jgi:hypothetical protein
MLLVYSFPLIRHMFPSITNVFVAFFSFRNIYGFVIILQVISKKGKREQSNTPVQMYIQHQADYAQGICGP